MLYEAPLKIDFSVLGFSESLWVWGVLAAGAVKVAVSSSLRNLGVALGPSWTTSLARVWEKGHERNGCILTTKTEAEAEKEFGLEVVLGCSLGREMRGMSFRANNRKLKRASLFFALDN